jgi:cephalosporin hydroxylase
MSWKDIPGWFNFADIYDEAVETARDGDTLVEVGTAMGRSIAYLARKTIESGKNLRIVAVDLWGAEPSLAPGEVPDLNDDTMGFRGRHHALWKRFGNTFRVFLGCMIEHAPEELEKISVVRLRSTEAALMFSECHMVFLDGDHSYQGMCADVEAWRSRVRAGGIFAGHDYGPWFPGVAQAIDERVPHVVQGTCWRAV